MADKAAIKDKYQAYKTSSTSSKDLEITVENSRKLQETLQQQLVATREQIANANKSVAVAPVNGTFVDDSVVQRLDEEVLRVSMELQEREKQLKQAESDLELVRRQLNEVVQEKRTDVMLKKEEELSSLRSQLLVMSQQHIELEAEKKRSDLKTLELTDRVTRAEQELRDKDRRDANPSDTDLLIRRQREDIILKSQAATSGWNAAAVADERVDKEVLVAFEKGREEERQQHLLVMEELNKAVELKENRIGELLEEKHLLEIQSLQRERDLQQRAMDMDKLQVEMQETISAISSGNLLGGGDDNSDEVVELKSALDEAQEELVKEVERSGNLQKQLDVVNRKIQLMEQLLSSPPSTSNASAEAPPPDLQDLIANVKKAIVKGTNLWKGNKRDDCFDLYLDTCEDTNKGVKSSDLKAALSASISSAKTHGLIDKQKGAVLLRKAMDKFLIDAQLPSVKKAEEDLRDNSPTPVNNDQQRSALMNELKSLSSPLPPTDDPSPSASLLQRARLAEEQVEKVKRQLATVLEAAARNNSQQQQQTSPQVIGGIGGGGGVGGGSEVRMLKRKLKELEMQIKSGSGVIVTSSGGGGGNNDKALQKKLKDQEAQSKKEVKILEGRVNKAEASQQKLQTSFNEVSAERDKLRLENNQLGHLKNDLESFKLKADRCSELEVEVKKKEEELSVLSDQFKKETALRKKYKNELEDLKGAIRVYARCRPMAKYELENGTKKNEDV